MCFEAQFLERLLDCYDRFGLGSMNRTSMSQLRSSPSSNHCTLKFVWVELCRIAQFYDHTQSSGASVSSFDLAGSDFSKFFPTISFLQNTHGFYFLC